MLVRDHFHFGTSSTLTTSLVLIVAAIADHLKCFGQLPSAVFVTSLHQVMMFQWTARARVQEQDAHAQEDEHTTPAGQWGSHCAVLLLQVKGGDWV